METIKLNKRWYLENWILVPSKGSLLTLFFALLLILNSLPWWIYKLDPTAALPDAGILSVFLLAMLVFLLLLALCAYIFKVLLRGLGIPAFTTVVSQFKKLELWQQFIWYGLAFALLLLVATGCLIALC